VVNVCGSLSLRIGYAKAVLVRVPAYNYATSSRKYLYKVVKSAGQTPITEIQQEEMGKLKRERISVPKNYNGREQYASERFLLKELSFLK
jgi:hypothetical protein